MSLTNANNLFQQSIATVCPTCHHCPTCGRTTQIFPPYQPAAPYQPTYWTNGTTTQGAGNLPPSPITT